MNKNYYRIGFNYGKLCHPAESIFSGESIEDAIMELKKLYPNTKKICYFTEVKKADFDKEQKIRDLNNFLKRL